MKPQIEVLENRNLLDARPNIVLILTDDQRYDTMQYMPKTLEIFEPGTNFSNAFTTTPLCCPSRASILSGEYAHNHGVTNNFRGHLFDEENSLAPWLDDAYQTAFFGKYLNLYQGKRIPPGWDEWQAFSGLPKYYHYTLNENGALRHYKRNYSTDLLARRAVDFIENSGEEPFFVFYSTKAPHGEGSKRLANPTPPFRYKNTPIKLHRKVPGRIRSFATDQIRTLLAVDDAVHSIYSAVESIGEAEETIFIYASDNGFLWGEHGNGKGKPFDDSIRIPLLIRNGGTPSEDRTGFALNIDLAPTILDYAGISMSETFDGVSLKPSIEGNAGLRSYFLIENPGWRGIRSNDVFGMTMYVIYHNGREEFYIDQWQSINVIGFPEFASALDTAKTRLSFFDQ